MNKTFILIVYDISSDKRRTKLHNLLLDFGTPVQYSVFECLLDATQIATLKSKIRKVIRPRKDNLRYYYLCQDCLKKTEVTTGKEVLHKESEDIIV